jgi:predicted dehydrogenase
MQLSRRQFLKSTATAAAFAGTIAGPNVFGANERIGICTIGFNGRGSSHIHDLLKLKDDAEYVALCDVDSKVLERGMKSVTEAQGKAPKGYQDIRQALENKEVDAVTIATPNHWHTLAAIWACEAGKDVYVEKPAAHSIYEGRQLVAAAEKHKRVVQHGTQSRANPGLVRDLQLIHRGFIGEIVESRGYV